MTVEEMYRTLHELTKALLGARTSGPNQIPFEVDSWAQALTESWREASSRVSRLCLHRSGHQLQFSREVLCCETQPPNSI